VKAVWRQSAGFQIRASTPSSSWPAALPRLAQHYSRTKLGPCERQAHILPRLWQRRASPSLTSNPLGQNAEVGRGLGGLVAVRDDVDLGPDGDGPELALIGAAVVLGRRVRSQSWSYPLRCQRGPISLRVAKRPMGSAPPAKPSPAAFFPAGRRVRLLAAASLQKSCQLRCSAFAAPLRVRRRFAPHNGLAIARGSAPREQQKRTRP